MNFSEFLLKENYKATEALVKGALSIIKDEFDEERIQSENISKYSLEVSSHYDDEIYVVVVDEDSVLLKERNEVLAKYELKIGNARDIARKIVKKLQSYQK